MPWSQTEWECRTTRRCNLRHLRLIVEILKLVLPLLVTVTGKLSVWPSTTSPKRKIVGLKVNWVAAAAGTGNPAVKRKAANNRKKTYLIDLLGEGHNIFSLPVSERSVKVSTVHIANEKDLCTGRAFSRRKMAKGHREVCGAGNNVRCRTVVSAI